MAPPGCLPRCHPRGSVHRRGRARHLPPPPRRPSRGPGFPSVARRCAREDRRGSGRPAGAGTRPDRQAHLAGPAERPPRRRGEERRRRRRRTARRAGRTRGRAHPEAAAPERPEARPLEFLCHARGAARPGSGGFLPAGKAPLSPVREGPEEPPPPSPEGLDRLSPSLAIPHRPPRGATAGRPASRSTGEAARGGAGAPPGGAVPSTPPSSTRAALSRARRRAGLGRTRGRRGARAVLRTGDRRSAAPDAAARGSGPAAPPPSGGDGPAADRRKSGGGKRRRRRDGGESAHASRPGRDTRSSAGRAPPARTVAGTRGASPRRAPPVSPPPEVPRASVSLSLGLRRAAARRVRPTAAAPSGRACGPRFRPRSAAEGRACERGAGVRETPHARPAGRPGSAAGAKPHR